MRNRLKKQPPADVDRKVKEFETRTRKRIEEQAKRLKTNYQKVIARNLKRHTDRIRDLDKQIKQIEKQGVGGNNDGGRPDRWYHMLQPAWSLSPLWLRFNTIHTWSSFAPHEVPLSRLQPVKTVQNSSFGRSWTWQADRNVRGGALRNSGSEHGWGLGVHATSELHFALPPFARQFQSHVGLDEIVGPGGCVRAEVHVATGETARRLFRSEPLVGSSQGVDTGKLQLDSSGSGGATDSGGRFGGAQTPARG